MARETLSQYQQNADRNGESLQDQFTPFHEGFEAFLNGNPISSTKEDAIPIPMACTVKVPIAEMLATELAKMNIDPQTPIIPIANFEAFRNETRGLWNPSYQEGEVKLSFNEFCQLALHTSSEIAFRDAREYLIQLIGFDEMQRRVQEWMPSTTLLPSSLNHGMLLSEGGNTATLYDLVKYFAGFIQRVNESENLLYQYHQIMFNAMRNNNSYAIGIFPNLQNGRILPRGFTVIEKIGIVPPTWDNRRLVNEGYPPHFSHLVIGAIINPNGDVITFGYTRIVPIPLPKNLDEYGEPIPGSKNFVEEVMDRLKRKWAETEFKRGLVQKLKSILPYLTNQ